MKTETKYLVCERPRERAKAHGPAALSDVEILALVLQGAGAEPDSALAQARGVLMMHGTLGVLLGKSAAELAECGLSENLALRVVASAELARRMFAGTMDAEYRLERPELIAQFMAPVVAGLDVEKFWVLCLNRKNRLIKRIEITSGTATAAMAHPREVFRAAIRESATAIVCVHNHPSGDPAPSAPDMQTTRLLREAAKTVDIALLDHVIIGRAGAAPLGRGHFSFREAGML